MLPKETKLYSVVLQKCPRCHEGDMFAHGPYSRHFSQMNNSCSVCGLDFIQEPSFYWGAMYFSYAVQVAVFTVLYFLLQYTLNPDAWVYVLVMIVSSIGMLPLNFQLSRAAWINLFVSYQKKAEA
jgi:uncharacterized protein (DUF983 family)